MKNVALWILLTFLITHKIYAKEGDTLTVKWQLYMDWYYKQRSETEISKSRPSFLYNYRLSNKPSLNFALANAELHKGRVQAKLGIMRGDYVTYNLENESDYARLFYQANIGFQLTRKQDLWVEAGLFPSHIGVETVIGFDQHNLTRTIAADNSPYYEAGLRVNWKSKNGKFYLSGLLLNGWQTTQLTEKKPSYGFQFTWTPSSHFSFNYSNYIEKNSDSETRTQRIFHNFYITSQLSRSVALIGGYDTGSDKIHSINKRWYTLYSTLKWSIFKTGAVGARIEYFNSPRYGILPYPYPHGLMSSSVNIDKTIDEWVKVRIEARWFNSTEYIFFDKKSLFMYTLGICAKLGN